MGDLTGQSRLGRGCAGLGGWIPPSLLASQEEPARRPTSSSQSILATWTVADTTSFR